MKKYLILTLAALLALAGTVYGQSYPFTAGSPLTAAGLNSAFAARTTFSLGNLNGGYVLLGNGGGDITAMPNQGSAGQVLTSNGSNNSPSWQSVGAGTSITGLSVTATGALSTGTTGLFNYGTVGFSDANMIEAFAATANNYVQNVLQNKSNGTAASADYVVSNNLSTATTYYGDFGINSSTFTGTGSLSLPNAVYVSAASGDLVLGTVTSNAIRFAVNSGATDVAIIQPAGYLQINPLTIAALPTCNTASEGAIAYVKDTVGNAAPTFHGTVTGGGATAIHSLVTCNGTNWQYD
jgi:hypothetical protein